VGDATEHLIPDVLVPDLDVVFCGTAPSAASLAAGAPYAKPGNRFWPTLHKVGFTPRRLAPQEFTLLPEFGLGFTDVCKTVSGQDADLPKEAFDPAALHARVVQAAPRYLAFTSKRAAQEALQVKTVDYGPQNASIGNTKLYVLPSTSGLATRFWDESWWRRLANLTKP
jgi:TDG/mug DNA glycosylase family protein